jgi:F-type H+-transporting ATPase subunit b
MRVDNHSQATSAPARRSGAARWRAAIALAACLSAGLLVHAPVLRAASLQPPAETPLLEGHAEEPEHAEGALPTVARVINFALLAGLLVYFLKGPTATYVGSRSAQIRQDLVTAAEIRAAATAQLAEIERKVKSLPAELDALRERGAEDVASERERIAQAARLERERLLEHTRREIQMQLRIAHRELVAHAAQLAVDVARARIVSTITPDDQLRLVDRYAAQLKEAR